MNYVTDIVTLLLFFLTFQYWTYYLRLTNFSCILRPIFAYTFVVCISSIVHLVPTHLFIWAVRNTYRFFVFFFACIVLLSKKDIERIYDILFKFQFLNIILVFYQFVYLNKKQDYLGGIFGTEIGCNGPMNLYLCILLIWSFCMYLHNKEKAWKFIFILISSLTIAVFAELKLFFVETVIILLLIIFLSDTSVKIFIIGVLSSVIFILLFSLLESYDPYSFSVLRNYANFIDYFSMYGIAGYNISRLHAFSQISNWFFRNNWFLELFGFGFGACETASFSLLQSEFFRRNGAFNYRYFAHAMIFLETGYLGIITYIWFFIECALYSWKGIKKKIKNIKPFSIIVITTAVICIINLWYNYALKIEYAYMIYFVLANSAIVIKDNC